jgi:hypothetical protein
MSLFIILLCQANHHMPLKKIHHFVNKSYIIWNLKFCQVYIFDLPLLLTQNNYLDYSKIKPYALVKKIHWPMRLIILFSMFIHTITPSHNIIIYNYNSYILIILLLHVRLGKE